MDLERFVVMPENRSALAAIRVVLGDLLSGGDSPAVPLYLHGPSGTGKTHLISALAKNYLANSQNGVVWHESGSDFGRAPLQGGDKPYDLLVFDDLQRFSRRARRQPGLAQSLHILFESGRSGQMVFAATVAPAHLDGLPARLRSRLAGGLVVAIERLAAPSRFELLEQMARQQKIAIAPDILSWLAERVPGEGRQLQGVVIRLQTLTRTEGRPLTLQSVAKYFGQPTRLRQPTVERIAEYVARYFAVDRRQLQASRRSQEIVWPRQLGMYLSRRLTGLSLEKIGAYFGKRDHGTVLYACRKVQKLVDDNAAVAGTVKELQSNLL